MNLIGVCLICLQKSIGRVRQPRGVLPADLASNLRRNTGSAPSVPSRSTSQRCVRRCSLPWFPCLCICCFLPTQAGRGYGLLYTLWLVLEGRKVLEGGCPWDATQLASVGLLALELSHYRMLNSWLPVSAQGWLMKLEGCVAKHLEKADSNHLAASGFYMLALTSDGKQFFESVYPLLLTETLTAFPSADQGRRMQNLQLCHAVLSSPMNTMQSYMGASKTGVSYDGKWQ